MQNIYSITYKAWKSSKEYISGKLEKYVNPFQLYLHVSIIFFLILGISNNIDSTKNPINDIATATKTLDSVSKLDPRKLDSIKTEIKRRTAEFMPKDSANAKAITELENAFELETWIPQNQPLNVQLRQNRKHPLVFFDKIADFENFRRKFPTYTNEQALDSLGYQKIFWNTFYYQ